MKFVFLSSLVGVILFCILLIVACGGGANEQTRAFDKTKMFKDIGEVVIIKGYEEFSIACEVLVASYATYHADKNQPNFESLRTAWRKAQSAWEETESYGFGPTLNSGYIYNIDFSPCRLSLIESTLASKESFVEGDFETIGAAAKGLPVIEYLLYKPSIANDFTLFLTTEQEQTFFESLVKFTATNSKNLLNEWLASDGNFIETFSSPGLTNLEYMTEQKVVDDIVNELIVQIEVIRDKKIGKPLGKNASGPLPELSEAPYSKTSLESIKANLKGIQAHFTYVENRLMLIDYLDAINAEHSKTINKQLEKIKEKLDQQLLSLEVLVVSDGAEVEELFDLFAELVKQVKYMVTAMGVTLHTSDNDGD